MSDRYNKALGFTPSGPPVDEPPVVTMPRAGSRYDPPSSYPPPPGAPATRKPGEPFGELRPRDPMSWTDYLKDKAQDALIALGIDPHKARHVGHGLVGVGGVTPMGTVLSLGDLAHHTGRGQFGDAAWDLVGAAPLLGGIAKAARGRPQVPQIQAAFEPPPWARGPIPGRTSLDSPGEIQALIHGAPVGTPPGPHQFFSNQTAPLGPARSWITPSAGELSGSGGRLDPILGAAQRGYRAVENAPVAFHPGTGPYLAGNIDAAVRGIRANSANAPAVYATVDRHVADWASHGGPVTPSDLMALRDELRNLSVPLTHPRQGAVGRHASDVVDQFMTSPPRGAQVMGTPQDAAEMGRNLAAARANYRAGETSEMAELGGIENPVTRTNTTHSGKNLENTVDQRLQELSRLNPKTGEAALFGATPEELSSIMAASQPGLLRSAQRSVGKTLGGGGGLGKLTAVSSTGSAAGTGALAMGVDPFTAGAIGLGTAGLVDRLGSTLIKGGNQAALRGAESALAGVRRNSPLSEARSAMEPVVSDPRGMMREAITYALMPKVADTGRDIWNEQFVPYANRDEKEQEPIKPRPADDIFEVAPDPLRIRVNPEQGGYR